MRIDTHQFFWRYSESEYGSLYPWSLPDAQRFRRDRLPGDLLPLMKQAGIDATIVVQVRQKLEENSWLLELADQHTFIRGVIGWVDLLSPKVQDQLERFAAHPRLCGIRYKLEFEADDRLMLRPEFLRGMSVLAQYGLPFDFLIRARHLTDCAELARTFPYQRFVLDHIGKPSIKTGELSPWEQDLRRLASLPNVFCKLSGMVGEADWSSWKPADFRPYLDVVLAAFGTKRLAFGSDWPECNLAASYLEVVQLVSDYTAELSEVEQTDIWWNNAERIYRL